MGAERSLPLFCLYSHHHAAALALAPARRGRLDRTAANLLKGELEQVARDGGALGVLVGPHLLRHSVGFLGVDDAIGVLLGTQVALEAQDDDGEMAFVLGKGRADLLDPLRPSAYGGTGGPNGRHGRGGCTYKSLHIDKAQSLADIKANDDQVRPQ